MANAKQINELNDAASVSADTKLAVAQPNGTEAEAATVSKLAEAISDVLNTGALAELTYATSQGKNAIATVLTNKGVDTTADETLISMADKINSLDVQSNTELLTAYSPEGIQSVESFSTADSICVFPYDGYKNIILKNNTLYMVPEGKYDTHQAMLDAAVATITTTNSVVEQSNATYTLDGGKILILTKDTSAIFHVEIYNVDWENESFEQYAIVTPTGDTYVLTEASPYMCDPEGKFLLWSASNYANYFYMWDIANSVQVGTRINSGGSYTHETWMTSNRIFWFNRFVVYTGDGNYQDWTGGQGTAGNVSTRSYDPETGVVSTTAETLMLPAYNNSCCRILDKKLLIIAGFRYTEVPNVTGSSASYASDAYPRRLGLVAVNLETGLSALIPNAGYDLSMWEFGIGSTSYYMLRPYYMRYRKINENEYNILFPGLPEDVITYNAETNTFSYNTEEVNGLLLYQINDRDQAFAVPLTEMTNGSLLKFSVSFAKQNNAMVPICGGNRSLSLYSQNYRKKRTLFGMSKFLGSGNKKSMLFPNMTQSNALTGLYDADIDVSPAVPDEE